MLSEYQWLWRPQPYKGRPAWCQRLPALTAQLLALSDEALALLDVDNAALLKLLAGHIPELAEFAALCEVQPRITTPLNPISPHLSWAIPGRKWSQIESFAQSIGPIDRPLLEWCGGKGHLGRLLAVQWQQPATTLDRDEGLCDAGAALAQRARVTQRFEVVDVLTPAAIAQLPGHHAIALHACGELHRTLVRQAVAARLPAFDIAPCCYHLQFGKTGNYQPFTPMTTLQLGVDDLRLSVTETVTSSARVVSQRDQEMAWKLGFDRLYRDLSDEHYYHPIKSVEKVWLQLGFAGFCHTLAAREGFAIGAKIDWSHYEALGWQLRHEVMRLNLVRYSLRRPLELWLVLDMACYLNEQGYRVELGSFCDRQITPRNLLLSARL